MPTDDGFTPPIVVTDQQDAIIVIHALQHYGDAYLDAARLLAVDPTVCPVDKVTTTDNASNVIHRIIRMIDAIGADAPADSVKEN